MEKRLAYFEFQSVKSVAKAIDPYIRNRETINKKITAVEADYAEKLEKLKQAQAEKVVKLQKDIEACNMQIDALEAGILAITGYHVEQLVKKVIALTGKTDKEGKPLKETKYVPTDIVTYDEANKQYIISIDITEPPINEEPVVEAPIVEEAVKEPTNVSTEDTPQTEESVAEVDPVKQAFVDAMNLPEDDIELPAPPEEVLIEESDIPEEPTVEDADEAPLPWDDDKPILNW